MNRRDLVIEIRLGYNLQKFKGIFGLKVLDFLFVFKK